MITAEITRETPVVQLTIGQLADYLNANPDGKPQTIAASAEKPARLVYGLKGIMTLFGVSNVTAQRYKRGIIAPAVYQQGRKIVVDAEKALQLFREAHPAE